MMPWLALLVILVGQGHSPAVGQPVYPQRYHLRRVTILAPTLPPPYREGWEDVWLVEAVDMICGLIPGPLAAAGFRVQDPATPSRDCEWLAPPDLPIFTTSPKATYRWEITQQWDSYGAWSTLPPPEQPLGPPALNPGRSRFRMY